MRFLGVLTLTCASFAFSAQAADDVSVFRAQLTGPSGNNIEGKIVTIGDRIVFVDDGQLNRSFSIARSDVRRITLENGVLTVDLARPFTDRYGEHTSLLLRTSESADLDAVVRWAGMPLSGSSTSAAATSSSIQTGARVSPRTDQATAVYQENRPAEAVMYQAKHDHAIGNCTGRLIIRDDGMAYESVSEAGHSRSWKWADIKEVDRNNSENKVIIEPRHGDDFTLKLTGQAMEDTVYKSIADHIAAARQGLRLQQ